LTEEQKKSMLFAQTKADQMSERADKLENFTQLKLDSQT